VALRRSPAVIVGSSPWWRAGATRNRPPLGPGPPQTAGFGRRTSSTTRASSPARQRETPASASRSLRVTTAAPPKGRSTATVIRAHSSTWGPRRSADREHPPHDLERAVFNPSIDTDTPRAAGRCRRSRCRRCGREPGHRDGARAGTARVVRRNEPQAACVEHLRGGAQRANCNGAGNLDHQPRPARGPHR